VATARLERWAAWAECIKLSSRGYEDGRGELSTSAADAKERKERRNARNGLGASEIEVLEIKDTGHWIRGLV